MLYAPLTVFPVLCSAIDLSAFGVPPYPECAGQFSLSCPSFHLEKISKFVEKWLKTNFAYLGTVFCKQVLET